MNRHSPCARVLTDRRGFVLSVEPSFTDMFGWPADQVVGDRIGKLAHPQDLRHCLKSWVHMLKAPERNGQPVRIRYRHLYGYWVWVDVVSHVPPGSEGQIATDLVDVRSEVELIDLLAARDQLLAHVSDVTSLGTFHVDVYGRLLYANRALEEITKVSDASTLARQLARVDERERPRFTAAIELAGRGAVTAVQLKASGARWRVRLRPVFARSGIVRGVSGCVEEVSDLGTPPSPVSSDPLTGCLSLEATLRALDYLVARRTLSPGAKGMGTEGRRHGDGRGTACLVVNLGGLEVLTERNGPTTRNELLSLVALRARDSVRSSDVVGRTGDTEFAVVCAGVPTASTALTIGRSILDQVARPMVLKSGFRIELRPGIGVSWTADATAAAARLLRQAQDAALESTGSDTGEPVLAASVALDVAGARLAALTTAASDASRIDESIPTPHQVSPSGDSAST